MDSIEEILVEFGFTYQDQVTQDGYLKYKKCQKYYRKDGNHSEAVKKLKENGYKAIASVSDEGATILVK